MRLHISNNYSEHKHTFKYKFFIVFINLKKNIYAYLLFVFSVKSGKRPYDTPKDVSKNELLCVNQP